MTAFSAGSTASLTLDEWDQLTVSGKARLVVTITGHIPFETETFGNQVVGPFGEVTAVSLTGIGIGTYEQGPSNVPVPMYMVDISPAQRDAPTTAMLAAKEVFYQLNESPFTIYRSNGSAIVSVGAGGEGGAAAYTELSDAATVNLATVNSSVAAVKATADAASTAVAAKAPIANPTFTGTVSGVTKAHVGLGNVDNTSDANKPVSTAAQTALNLKASLASPTFTGTVSGITKAHVGLGSVDNTPDSSKPVSTAQGIAIAARAPGGNTVALPGTTLTITAALHDGNTISTQSASATTITLNTGLALTAGVAILQSAAGAVTVNGTATLVGDTAALTVSGTALVIIPTGTTDTYRVFGIASGIPTLAGMSDVVTYDLATNNTSIALVKAQSAANLSALAGKQATLISGTNIATVAGQSLLAGGNIDVSTTGGSSSILTVTPSMASVGDTLTATFGSGWSGTLQWTKGGVDISGETGSTYLLVSGDAAAQIKCRASSATYTSNAVTPAGAGAGLLTITTITAAAEDVTAAGYADWWHLYGGSSISGGQVAQKAGATILPNPPTVTNVGSYSANALSSTAFTWTGTDAVNGDGTTVSPATCDIVTRLNPTDPTLATKISWTVAADTVSRTFRILCGTFRDDGASHTANVTFRATLSDGSATAIVSSVQGAADGITQMSRSFAFRAANGGETCTFSVELDANSGGELYIAGVTYQ